MTDKRLAAFQKLVPKEETNYSRSEFIEDVQSIFGALYAIFVGTCVTFWVLFWIFIFIRILILLF